MPQWRSESRSVVSDCLRPHGRYSPWNFPCQNTGVGSLSLLRGIFPTQGLNPSLLHCRQTLYQLSHKGSPRILEWVAYPFFSGSSRPRNQTGVSWIAGRLFTSWATRSFGLSEEVNCHCWNNIGHLVTYEFQVNSEYFGDWASLVWSSMVCLHCRQILYQLSYQGSPPPH